MSHLGEESFTVTGYITDFVHIFSLGMIVFFLLLPSATGQPPQTGQSPQTGDCWDLLSNCSKYKNHNYCKPGFDKHEHERVPWFFMNCQKTCICDKLSKENKTDKKPAHCQKHKHDAECLQRPPAEEFRNECAFTCFISRTPVFEGFQTSPKDKNVKVGIAASFECSIKSTILRVNFTWYKNNVLISPGKKVSVNSNSSASKLTIMRADVTDEGKYHCKATNTDYELELSWNSSVGILSIEKGPNSSLIIGLVVGLLVVVVMTCLVVRKVLKSRKHKEKNNEYPLHVVKDTETPLVP